MCAYIDQLVYLRDLPEQLYGGTYGQRDFGRGSPLTGSCPFECYRGGPEAPF